MAASRRKASSTALDVARLAGVAPATAARVLGGYGSASADVRERVLRAAATLKYRPNRLAQSMVTGTTQTIGVVIADIENPFFALAVRGISDAINAVGSFDVILANSDEDVAKERAAVRTMLEKQVDGLIVAPASAEKFEHLADMRELNRPLVLLDRNIPSLGTDAVFVDGFSAAKEATSRLIRLGHRRIGVITDTPAMAPSLRPASVADGSLSARPLLETQTWGSRLAGYLAAHEEAGLMISDDLVRHAAPTAEAAAEQTAVLLDLAASPTAIFTTDNVMTLGAFETLQDRQVDVPGSVSLLGFDDARWTRIVQPRISVLAQPVHELGMTAARLLVDRLRGSEEQPQATVLPTTLVWRESVREVSETSEDHASEAEL